MDGKTERLFLALATAALAAATTPCLAQGSGDLGKKEYESNCALCHGKDLRGGDYVDFLKVTPTNLAELSKKNGGVFPFERVYAVIDGRQTVRGHGTSEMPIWGKTYQVLAAEHYADMRYDPEAFIRGRILALVDYLNRMQGRQ